MRWNIAYLFFRACFLGAGLRPGSGLLIATSSEFCLATTMMPRGYHRHLA
jgi:hypothetical protein